MAGCSGPLPAERPFAEVVSDGSSLACVRGLVFSPRGLSRFPARPVPRGRGARRGPHLVKQPPRGPRHPGNRAVGGAGDVTASCAAGRPPGLARAGGLRREGEGLRAAPIPGTHVTVPRAGGGSLSLQPRAVVRRWTVAGWMGQGADGAGCKREAAPARARDAQLSQENPGLAEPPPP